MPKINYSVVLCALMAITLSACGGGSGGSSNTVASGGGNSGGTGGTPGNAMSREGTVQNQMLMSDVDGEAIAFTVFEPTTFVDGQTYPIILHSHGYGGSRQTTLPADGLLRRLLDNGYGIISIDERGHGESGGTIRILDPDFEGRDLLQILDWAEVNLQWLAYDSGATPDTGFGRGNPIMGATGGSYGGGYQHLIYAMDPLHRLDAIAPDITWHDLRYSLFSSNVFKTFWATLLSVAGNAPPNRQDAQVNQGLTEGLSMNTLSQMNQDLLYRNSLRSHCEGMNDSTAPGGLTPIDALLTQSGQDTLFNFNDAYGNFQCLSDQGGDVRLFTKAVGHGIDNGDSGDQCGSLQRADATFAWFEEKIKGVAGAAASIPQVCLMLEGEGSDAVALDIVPVGTADAVSIPQQTLALSPAAAPPASIPIFTAGADGAVLAGIPTIELTILDSLLGENGLGDPTIFVAIGRRSGGTGDFTVLQNQYRPFRGYGTVNEDLIGVFTRLAAGDELALMLFTAEISQYATSSTKVPTTVTVDASVRLPLISSNQTTP